MPHQTAKTWMLLALALVLGVIAYWDNISTLPFLGQMGGTGGQVTCYTCNKSGNTSTCTQGTYSMGNMPPGGCMDLASCMAPSSMCNPCPNNAAAAECTQVMPARNLGESCSNVNNMSCYTRSGNRIPQDS